MNISRVTTPVDKFYRQKTDLKTDIRYDDFDNEINERNGYIGRLTLEYLPDKSKILLYLIKNGGEMINYTNLIGYLGELTGISDSTVRHNLSRLRRLGMIESGCEDNKGIPTRVTKFGDIVVSYLMKPLNVIEFEKPIGLYIGNDNIKLFGSD